MLEQRYSLIAAAATVLTLTGCGGSSGGGPAFISPDEPSAQVQLLHASPDAPNVDVLVDGEVVLEDVTYKAASAFIELAEDSYDILVRARAALGNIPVISLTDQQLDADTVYTVIAAGSTDQLLNGGSRPLAELIVANPDEPVGAGNARVQVIHAAPSAPEVSVFATALDADLKQATPLDTLEFRDFTNREEVPADTYQIRVTLPFDPMDAGEPQVVFDVRDVELPDGADLVIVAVDNTGAGDAPVTALVLDENGVLVELLDVDTPADVRAVHAAPNAGVVDVLIDDAAAVEDLDFADVTAFLDPAPAPGTYNLKIVDSATGTVQALNIDPTFDAGKQYTAVAIGTSNIQADSRILEDDNRSIATDAKVRILHAAPSTGNVDIYVTDGPSDVDITTVDPDVANVEYREERGYIGLEERTEGDDGYDIRVTPANNDAIVAIDVQDQPLVAGCVYTIIARDAENQAGPLGVILIEDCPDEI